MTVRTRQFTEVISRVERVRKALRHSKSAFARAMGMTPQTYNNFVGRQGSKPSVALFHGVVNEFHVNPLWLLNGEGEMFVRELNGQAQPGAEAPEPRDGQHLGHFDGISADVNSLSDRVDAIGAALSDDWPDGTPSLASTLADLRRNLLSRPQATLRELRRMLDAFQRLLADPPASAQGHGDERAGA